MMQRPSQAIHLEELVRQQVLAMLEPFDGQALTSKRIEHMAGAITSGAAAVMRRALNGWNVAPHEDGSGDFGLYHSCAGDRSVLRVDCTGLNDMLAAVSEHVCGED